ncbi:MAG: PfkB family carbohydrate kinase [Candidatus Limnocylindrales bacterium]
MTRGLDGAVLVDEAGAVWRIGGPPERGRYPVGSGDSLLAGLAVALAAGFPLPEAARRGGAVGAANALVPGQGELDPVDAERIARDQHRPDRLTAHAIPTWTADQTADQTKAR